MALSKIDVANMLTGEVPNANVATVGVAKGGTGLTSGTTNQFLKFTGSTTLASAADNQGLAAASQWRLTTTFANSALPITSNWELADSDGYGSLGSNMTQSSGVFTFPSTGIWLITYHGAYNNSNANDRYVNTVIQTDTGSGFDKASITYANIPQGQFGTSTGAHGVCDFVFDVTNVSTHKIRFGNEITNSQTQTYGDTNMNQTYITFQKLGDT